MVARVEVHKRVTLSLWMPGSAWQRRSDCPGEERAALGGELIRSLATEVDTDVEAAWSAEIRARLERVDAGTATTIPWSDARHRIDAAAGTDSPRVRHVHNRKAGRAQ